MMPDLAVELLMPPLIRRSPGSRRTSGSTGAVAGPAIFTAEFARTIDLVISIGDAFKGFHRQLLYTDSDALAVRRGHPVGAKLKRRDVSQCAARRVVIRGQNEDLIDGWLRPKASSGGSRWWCPAISRRCMSRRGPISSPSCPAG